MADSAYEPARPQQSLGRTVDFPGARYAAGTVADARCRKCAAYCACEERSNPDYWGKEVKWLRPRAEMVTPAYQRRIGLAVQAAMAEGNIHRRPFQEFVEQTITKFRGVMRYTDDGRLVGAGRIPDYTYAFGVDMHASWVRDMIAWADTPMDTDAVASIAARIMLVSMALIIAKPDIARRFSL